MYPHPLTAAQDLDRRLLNEVEAGRGVSQRSLARNLGVALGLTNLLLRRLARRGLIEIVKIRPNRVRYVITPAGVAEKARMTQAYLDYSIRFYVDIRERLQATLDSLSSGLCDSPAGKRIIFYGTGEVAEIAYVCVRHSDLELVAVADDTPKPPFFGLPVHRVDELVPGAPGTPAYGAALVTSVRDIDERRARLQQAGYPAERIYTL